MAVTGVIKWSCPTCTYCNWPSSVKCVLCGGPKPNEYNGRSPLGKYRAPSSGWSKLAHSSSAGGACFTPEIISADFNYSNPTTVELSHQHLLHEKQQQQHHKGSGNHGPKCKTKKWFCGSCTYSNWPNARQCTMCGAPRNKTVRNEPLSAARIEPNRTPRSESILDYAPGVGAVGGAALNSDDNSHGRDSPLHIPRSKNNSKRSSNTDNKVSNRKWKCQQCTYENWPRTSKCIMCQMPRRRTPSPPLSGSEDTTKVAHNVGSNSNVVLSSSKSPSPVHSRANSNSNETSSPVSSQYAGDGSTVGGGGSCPPLKSNMWDSSSEHDPGIVEVVPSSRLKSDSNEVRQIRNMLSNSDWLFINACLGIVNDDISAVKAYLRQEGDRARQLTRNESLVLGQQSVFPIGSTLVHLAIRFQRSETLSLLLTPAPSEARKRLPSQSSPDLASSIREEVRLSLIQHKGDWPCYFLTQLTTFTLPSDICKFCSAVQKRALDEIVDRDVERELSSEAGIINWSTELVDELGSQLYPLWNRTAGDCLLDSVLQATWGVVDRDSTLRRAMADSLVDGASRFYERWKEAEQRQCHAQGFSMDEEQLKQDWAAVVALADQTGKSLEQIHILALAHIFRRPIIVYGVKVVKNFRGENLGFVNFEGVYLPLLWEASFCWKTPIALAYTRGHFSALLTMPRTQESGAGVWSNRSSDDHVTYLPLVDGDGRQLKIHFLTEQEIGCDERLLNEYCDCLVTRVGTLTAVQEVSPQQMPTLVTQLVDQWLDRLRRMDKRREASSCTYDSDS